MAHNDQPGTSKSSFSFPIRAWRLHCESRNLECWKFLDSRVQAENDSGVHGQPSFACREQWSSMRNREEVVTPLMLDGTYLSRNFATLGPMIRQPPCDLKLFFHFFSISRITIPLSSISSLPLETFGKWKEKKERNYWEENMEGKEDYGINSLFPQEPVILCEPHIITSHK